jgi:leader peptidase (prepilin peptidase) / N-methyltransferase
LMLAAATVLEFADRFVAGLLTHGPLGWRLACASILGVLAGVFVRVWSTRIARQIDAEGLGWNPVDSSAGAVPPARFRGVAGPVGLLEVALAGLFASYVWAVTVAGCQDIPEQGLTGWLHWRIAVHLALFALLATATLVDLRDYLIPDSITLPGMLLGLAGALVFNHVHLVPLWIDWYHEHPLTGPYIPEWMKQHAVWHALGVSVGGIVAGMSLTWGLRWLASRLVGQEAMGLGDVTLMGMIGAVIGWQPIVFVGLVAPLCGLLVGVAQRLCSGRTAIPFGPYIALAAVIVMFTWKWLWLSTRLVFGHMPSLLGLLGGMVLLLVVLLGLLRMYREIPTGRRRATVGETDADGR